MKVAVLLSFALLALFVSPSFQQEPPPPAPEPPQPEQPTQEEVQAQQEQNAINEFIRRQQLAQQLFRQRGSIKCWHCTNAKTNAECLANGKVKQCNYNQKSCQNTIRVNHGRVRISKRCKQSRACRNNQNQNGRAAWLGLQCNIQPQNIVCRCCCESNACNDKALYCRGPREQNNLGRYETEQYEREENKQPKQPSQEEVQEQQKASQGHTNTVNTNNNNNNDNNNNNNNNANNEVNQPNQPTQEEIQHRQSQAHNHHNQGACKHNNYCGNGGTCIDGANGSYSCQCAPGWGDSHCNTKQKP